MRRYIFVILFLLALVAPFVLRIAVTANDASATASLNSKQRLVIITPHNQDIRREFARAFSKWHQDKYGSPVALDFRSVGGAADIKRMLETSYAAYRNKDGSLPPPKNIAVGYDLVWGGGDNFFDSDLKPLGILLPLDAKIVKEAIPEPLLAGDKLYDITPNDPDAPIRWAGICLSSFGIIYNPDLLTALNFPVPKQWKDLTSPMLAGKIALADPTHSSSASASFMMVLQRSMADSEEAFFSLPTNAELKKLPKTKWPAEAAAAYSKAISEGWSNGMRTMLLIAANARYFTDSSEKVPNDVGNGDAAVGMVIDFYGRVEEANVGSQRARFVAPKNATAVLSDPVAILYGVTDEQRALANQFVEYLLSREGQLLWIKKPGVPGGPALRELGRPPIRKDVYADQKDWSDHLDPFGDKGSFNMRGAWMATFGEVRVIWAAAWIDDRDALVGAYRKILAVRDASKKQQLLDELSNLPVTMEDALATGVARKKAAAGGDVGTWSAQNRMNWAAKFREHYAAVAAKADE